MILYNIISLFTTFVVISLFLYLRTTKKIVQLDLTPPINAEYYYYFLALFCSSLCILTYLIILYFKGSKHNAFSDKYKKWLLIVQKYNIFFRAYSLIFDYLGPDYTIYLVKFAKRLVNYSEKKIVILIFIFVALPRIIILVTLFAESLMLKTLHYYFYSLVLLLIPLFFRFVIFVFTDLSPRLIPEFNQFFDVEVQEASSDTYKDTTANIGNPLMLSYKLKAEYSYMDIEDLLHNFYYPVVYLRGHMDVYVQPWYKKISFYSICCYLIIQVFLWGYLIFHVF